MAQIDACSPVILRAGQEGVAHRHIAPVMASSTTRQRSLAPEDLTTLPIVGGGSLSPDGTRVAYTVTTMNAVDDSYLGSIRVTSLSGGKATIYTRGTSRDAQPRWSPDGKRLLFISDRGERRQVWLLEVDGGEPYPAPEVPGDVGAASFSPDGRFIAVVATPNDNRREILRRGWRRIDRMRYRADGYGYLDDNPRIHIIDLAGRRSWACTDGSGNVGAPSWSRDGEHLAFAAEHRRDADSLFHTELWIIDAVESATPKKILTQHGCIEVPSWSHDGTLIAFVGHDDPSYSLGALRLHTVAPDGAGLRCLTHGPEWYCGNATLTDVDAAAGFAAPVFLANGDVLFLATMKGATSLFRIDRDRKAIRLTPPAQGVTEFFAGDKAIAFCASTTGTPPEIYSVPLEGGEARQVTAESKDWCDAHGVHAAERFQVDGAAGKIDAWRLQSSDAGTHPCVLEIHGGPHFAYGESFVFEFQLLAAAGYDVVFSNPRGSQGYGEHFVRAVVGDWAAPAYDDCIASLDAAIEAGGIDKDRLGVAGGSYGGYLTLWTLSRTRRFKAAVAMRSATDLTSLWGTSEVGRMLESELFGRPYDQEALYRANSPLTFADRIDTPLLLIHAEHDFRCPIEQSERLFT